MIRSVRLALALSAGVLLATQQAYAVNISEAVIGGVNVHKVPGRAGMQLQISFLSSAQGDTSVLVQDPDLIEPCLKLALFAMASNLQMNFTKYDGNSALKCHIPRDTGPEASATP